MRSTHFLGRQLVYIEGRAIVHSDKMDVRFVDVSLREAIPVFKQPDQSGRMLVELHGYLSFPEAAQVKVLHLTHECVQHHLPENFNVDFQEPRSYAYFDNSYQGTYALLDWGGVQQAPSTDSPYFFRQFRADFSDGNSQYYNITNLYPKPEEDFATYYAAVVAPLERLKNFPVGHTHAEYLEMGYVLNSDRKYWKP